MFRLIASAALLSLLAQPATAQTFDQKAVGKAVLKELIETNTTPIASRIFMFLQPHRMSVPSLKTV